MKVKAFDPAPVDANPAFQPHEVQVLGGAEGALVAAPESIGRTPMAEIVALSAFRGRDLAVEQVFLMLFRRGEPRPLLVPAAQIRFSDFPIQHSASEAENVRQLALYLCRQAERMVLDRATVGLLQKGGEVPAFERPAVALATSFSQVLYPKPPPPTTAPPPLPAPAPPAPAPLPAAPPPPPVVTPQAPVLPLAETSSSPALPAEVPLAEAFPEAAPPVPSLPPASPASPAPPPVPASSELPSLQPSPEPPAPSVPPVSSLPPISVRPPASDQATLVGRPGALPPPAPGQGTLISRPSALPSSSMPTEHATLVGRPSRPPASPPVPVAPPAPMPESSAEPSAWPTMAAPAASVESLFETVAASDAPTSPTLPPPVSPPAGSPSVLPPLELARLEPAAGLAPASPPAIPASTGRAFQPMAIQGFDPDLAAEIPAYRTRDATRIRGSEQGLSAGGTETDYRTVVALALFRSAERGRDETFLMLFLREQPRPFLAVTPQIEYADFPIAVSASSIENLRQLALYLCQRAGTMVTDRNTGLFLQSGGQAPLLEKRIGALATGLGRVLMPDASAAPASTALPAAPAGPPAAGPPAAGPPAAGPPAGAMAEPAVAPRSYAVSDQPRPRPYSDTEALTYPLRGVAFLVFLGFAVYGAVLAFVSANDPLAAPVWILTLFSMWFTPAIFFEIVRDTVRGSNTLETLPNFLDIGGRFRDVVAALLVNLVPFPLLTGGLLLLVVVAAPFGSSPMAALILLPGALFLYFFVGGIMLLAMGAAAIYDNLLVALRVDLHARAFFKCWRQVFGIFRRILIFFFLSVCLTGLLFHFDLVRIDMGSTKIPTSLILALLPTFAVGAFLAVDIAHVVGLLFRRKEEEMAAIYVYK